MLAGCYTLHLYCDVEDCERHGPDEFFAETGGECRRAARKIGWRIGRNGAKDLCPTHAKLRGKKRDHAEG